MDILERRSRHHHGLKRGDLIHLNFLCEKPQDGWFFWDGCEITLGTKTENGTYKIPEEFYIFEEFPPSYWSKYPWDVPYQESVIATKGLLKTSNLGVYTGHSLGLGNAIYLVEFQGEKYFISMSKPFAEKIMDSEDSKKFFCKSIEIPNDVLDFLTGSGIDTSTIYEKTVHVDSTEEEDLSQLIADGLNI
jgi:hypothetical protein